MGWQNDDGLYRRRFLAELRWTAFGGLRIDEVMCRRIVSMFKCFVRGAICELEVASREVADRILWTAVQSVGLVKHIDPRTHYVTCCVSRDFSFYTPCGPRCGWWLSGVHELRHATRRPVERHLSNGVWKWANERTFIDTWNISLAIPCYGAQILYRVN